MALFARILVPVDNSEESSAAVAVATRLARDAGADELCFCYVVNKDKERREAAGVDAGAYVEELIAETERAGTDAVERAKAQASGAGAAVTVALLEGEPSATIADLAATRGFDLIVTGTHDHNGIERVLFGSTAEKIMRRAAVPVLMVKCS